MGVFVISGSSSGIGAAVKHALRAAGQQVVGVDLQGAEVEADLALVSGRDAAARAITETSGALDGVVVAAGVAWPHPQPDLVVSVNFFGAISLLEDLRPLLTTGSDGYAVAVSSLAIARTALCPQDLLQALLDGDEEKSRTLARQHGAHAAYVTSKLALARWVREHSVRPEWAGAGIRLNAVAPGITKTPMMLKNALASSSSVDEIATEAGVPMGRAAQPDEVAALIASLLSPAASYLVGQVIFVDGGLESLARMYDWPTQARG